MIYLELFTGFLKVGLFAFGGAYAAIPFIREVVLSYGWLNDDMLSYIIAVSESTPGPVMVNMATYVGSSKAGVIGAAIATFAVVSPAFIIIILIMVVLRRLLKNPCFMAVLGGLRSAVIGFIAATGIFMIYKNVFAISDHNGFNFDLKSTLLTAALAGAYFAVKKLRKMSLSPILFIVISAAAGMIVYGART